MRLLLVGRRPIILGGLVHALEGEADLDIVGRAETIEDANGMLETLHPDVLLIDSVATGRERDDQAMIRVARAPAKPPFSMAIGDAFIEDAFLALDSTKKNIVAALRHAASYAPPGPATERASVLGQFTSRDFEIVQRLIAGDSNDEIGASLGISPKTVEKHLSHLYAMTGTASRTELAVRTVREHWLDDF